MKFVLNILKFLFYFLLAPICVFFEKRDKILHFYLWWIAMLILSGISIVTHCTWWTFYGSFGLILLAIVKEELWDGLLHKGIPDAMDLRWSVVGVLHASCIYFILCRIF